MEWQTLAIPKALSDSLVQTLGLLMEDKKTYAILFLYNHWVCKPKEHQTW